MTTGPMSMRRSVLDEVGHQLSPTPDGGHHAGLRTRSGAFSIPQLGVDLRRDRAMITRMPWSRPSSRSTSPSALMPALGRGVGRIALEGLNCCDAADQHDLATRTRSAPPKPALVRAMTALEVDVHERRCQWSGATSRCGRLLEHTCAVDDHVDPAVGGEGLLDDTLRLARLRQVSRHDCGWTIEALGSRLKPVLSPPDEHTAGPPGRQGGRASRADARPSARHDDHGAGREGHRLVREVSPSRGFRCRGSPRCGRGAGRSRPPRRVARPSRSAPR